MSDSVTVKVSDEDYQKVLKAFKEIQQNDQEIDRTILNNPVSRVLQTRTIWNKQLDASVTEGLVSFDGEEPAWIPMRTIQGIYSYLSKTLNSGQI